ncbi:MAG: molybdopterin-binding protein [Clostridia bacterium]
MKKVKTEDAIGLTLCHDITRIIPGVEKGVMFAKGHVIQAEDVEDLLDAGKSHVFVWIEGSEETKDMVHENAAAKRLVDALLGAGLQASGPREGKYACTATTPGVIQIDQGLLFKINSIEEICVSTIYDKQVVGVGDPVMSCRVIPLFIKEAKLRAVEKLCQGKAKLLQLSPFRPCKVGLITTGSEVFTGRVKDASKGYLLPKLKQFGSSLLAQKIVDDDKNVIANSMLELLDLGAEMLIITGGMSVDPDDVTPEAVRSVATEIVTYGTPVLPGAMFMLAYHHNTPILALPAGVLHAKISVVDVLLPRILAGEKLTRPTIVRLGHGGLLK